MAHLAIDKGLNAQEVATILRLPQILQMMNIVRFWSFLWFVLQVLQAATETIKAKFNFSETTLQVS